MTSSSHLRATSLGAILLALALGVSACGSDDPKAIDDPTGTPSTSVTPTPTPTPTAAPLSPFEDKAPVKDARAFFVLVARAINAGDRSMASAAPYATPNGRRNIAAVFGSDLDHRALLPGPQPFTPVNVQTKGGTARLNICMKNKGWSLDRKTKEPWEKNSVGSVLLVMERIDGVWKFDRGLQGTSDCGGVKITEVTF